MWIFFTLLAATMQAFRNAFQSQLSKEVDVLGVTLARFLWAGPIALIYLISLNLYQPVASLDITQNYIMFAVGAALMQILATNLMVQLFKLKNFAVGAGLAKSEALMAAILGTFFFGTTLSSFGWLGVFIGGIAIFLLSVGHQRQSLSLKTIVMGVCCGTSFALTSLWIREASLSLDLAIPFTHRAAMVLLLVLSIQTLLLVGYLSIKNASVIKALWQRPKLTLLTSVASCFGSIGWFSAMSLQTVPLVKTLGQVEVFFMMLISVYYLKERVKIKDMLGLVLIAIAAIIVMWA